MKTILYVRSNGIYSDSRATKEITALLKDGYRVIAVGWDRDGGSAQKCAEAFIGADVEFLLYPKQIKSGMGLKNIRHMVGWFAFARRMYQKKRKQIDIVHVCDLDSCLLFYRACHRDRVKLVYDIYDYYIDTHPLPSLLGHWVERKEIDAINRADLTIICTEERREQIAKATPKRVIVIHNTPSVECLQAEQKYDYFYCGAFGPMRLIQEILEQYPNHSDLNFGFAGYGKYKDMAADLAERFENFDYLGQIPYDECLLNEATSTCLAAIYEPVIRNHRLCAPNKFYEALALGKPVIVCRGTGIDQIVQDHGIGVVIDYNAQEFYAAVRRLKQDASECKRMGKRARALYEEKYRWSRMQDILLEAYRAL